MAIDPKYRNQYQGRIDDLEAENKRLHEGGKQLDGVIRRLADENEELREELGDLQRQIIALEGELGEALEYGNG